MQKGSLWVKSQGLMPGRNVSCSSQKPSLRDPSWLRRVCSPRGSPGRSGVEKETSNWLKGDKALEDPTDLSAWPPLLAPGGARARSLRGCPASDSAECTAAACAAPLALVLCLQ